MKTGEFKKWSNFFLFHVVPTGDVCRKCICCFQKYLITRMFTDRIGFHSTLLPYINHKVAIYSIVIGLKNSIIH